MDEIGLELVQLAPEIDHATGHSRPLLLKSRNNVSVAHAGKVGDQPANSFFLCANIPHINQWVIGNGYAAIFGGASPGYHATKFGTLPTIANIQRLNVGRKRRTTEPLYG